jgi:hypothetical protein
VLEPINVHGAVDTARSRRLLEPDTLVHLMTAGAHCPTLLFPKQATSRLLSSAAGDVPAGILSLCTHISGSNWGVARARRQGADGTESSQGLDGVSCRGEAHVQHIVMYSDRATLGGRPWRVSGTVSTTKHHSRCLRVPQQSPHGKACTTFATLRITTLCSASF